jgi:hypothetical protein
MRKLHVFTPQIDWVMASLSEAPPSFAHAHQCIGDLLSSMSASVFTCARGSLSRSHALSDAVLLSDARLSLLCTRKHTCTRCVCVRYCARDDDDTSDSVREVNSSRVNEFVSFKKVSWGHASVLIAMCCLLAFRM